MRLKLTTPRTAYIVGLALIAILVTVQLAGTRILAGYQEAAAIEINLSGRQRMLSQRIALTAQQLIDPAQGATTEDADALRRLLKTCVSLMAHSHVALRERDADDMRQALAAGEPCLLPEETKQATLPDTLPDLSDVPRLETFLEQAWALATYGKAAGLFREDFVSAAQVGSLLRVLNARTFETQETSIYRVESMLALNWFLLIGLIVGEIAFIFQPMTRSVETSIDELEEANIRLSESEHRLHDFASCAAHQFWETDEKHRFTWVDAPGSNARIKDKSMFLGKPRWEVYKSCDVQADVNWTAHRMTLNAHKPFENFEYPLRFPDGGIVWWRVHGRPVFDAEGRFSGYRGTSLDITEEKQAEIKSRQAERMLALGQLTAGVAHDFNNLLSVIQGNAELIETEENALERKNNVAEIVAAVERGASLTGRLLAFGRVQNLKTEVIEIGELFDSMSALLRRTLGEDFDVQIVSPEQPLHVEVDRHQLEDAFVNLVFNARDACRQGGRLLIKATVQSRVVHMPLSGQNFGSGNLVCISFSDNGCGIEPATLSRIFEPFYTTKPVGAGSGLGLSMVYGFALQSGGFVDVTSQPGEGTTVDLYLPTSTATPERTPKAPASVMPDVEGRKILLLEDNLPFRAVARRMLQNLGFDVTEAGDGDVALYRLRAKGPFDLMLADIVLPGPMNGIQTVAEARKIQPGLKVLFSSGFAGDTAAEGDAAFAGQPILKKPYRRESLASEIARVLTAGPMKIDQSR